MGHFLKLLSSHSAMMLPTTAEESFGTLSLSWLSMMTKGRSERTYLVSLDVPTIIVFGSTWINTKSQMSSLDLRSIYNVILHLSQETMLCLHTNAKRVLYRIEMRSYSIQLWPHP